MLWITKLKFISYQHSNGEASYGKSLEILEIRVKEIKQIQG
ncbi:hypothetical protein [Prevotella intermedia]|nr:hypothetical protein [Prevotella intermedia]